MVNIHVVTARDRALRRREFELYNRWRHLLIGRCQDAAPTGGSLDEFDTDDAHHLIAVLGSEVVGGSRLISALHPTPMARCDEFSLADDDQRRRSVDWTGLFVVPAHRRGLRPFSVLGALYCGVMELVPVGLGVTRIGGMIATFWLDYLCSVGWRLDILGIPREFDGSMHIAALVQVDEAALANARAVTGITRPVLVGAAHAVPTFGLAEPDMAIVEAKPRRRPGIAAPSARRARSKSI